MFQSPSFRGGSTPGFSVLIFQPSCCEVVRFNPLRFGAGALPSENVYREVVLEEGVSIPFVSGREHSRGRKKDVLWLQRLCFNPLRFGAGALPAYSNDDLDASVTFQSPSFRGGSTPWPTGKTGVWRRQGFNPLRFGAGALPKPSMRSTTRSTKKTVSIPFVSGREHSRCYSRSHSLSGPLFQSPSFRGGSTPRVNFGPRLGSPYVFQSPSFRGGSTPTIAPQRAHPLHIRFNPLRFGAGALPRKLGCPRHGSGGGFQSPSFRGGSTPLR